MAPKFREKVASRKFALMLMIFLFSTLVLLAPAILTFFGANLAAIMTGGEYVSLIIGCFAIYSGANVAQKKIEQVVASPNNDDMMGD